ncbi:hypothetical protein XENOCAPTIV_030371 [Xenoophorus captivus]|uniref:Uncharacterized protein n=1 Tax=Xenoophorus captivus TaxID=1517983 RepID=A0ABV0S4C3_9TELE
MFSQTLSVTKYKKVQEVLMLFNNTETGFCNSLNVFILSDPMNGRVLQNVEKYEKLLGSAGPSRECSLRRPGSSYLRTRDTYERLCLTKGSQVFIKIGFFT